jgi:hypothetical protein
MNKITIPNIEKATMVFAFIVLTSVTSCEGPYRYVEHAYSVCKLTDSGICKILSLKRGSRIYVGFNLLALSDSDGVFQSISVRQNQKQLPFTLSYLLPDAKKWESIKEIGKVPSKKPINIIIKKVSSVGTIEVRLRQERNDSILLHVFPSKFKREYSWYSPFMFDDINRQFYEQTDSFNLDIGDYGQYLNKK